MFCSECGNKVDDQAKFCASCGAEIIRNDELLKVSPVDSESKLESEKITNNPLPQTKDIIHFNKKLIPLFAGIVIFIAIIFANHSNKSSNLSASENSDQTQPNLMVGDGLDVKLIRITNEDNDFCSFYFDIANHTKLNITGGMISVIEKDTSGTIVDKGYIHFTSGIKQNANSTLDMYASNCSKIASLDLKALETLMVDGEFASGINDGDVPLHSASETNIPVNSTAGGIESTNSSSDASANTQSSQQDSGTYEKLDSGVIAMKYSSNPFEVRKSLGKKYETEIFTDKFVDEGSTALVIDGNFGFYCRMKGDEFGQHNQRGTMVVRGILAESEGRIGLDNCTFVSNGSENAAPADAPAAPDTSESSTNN